MAYQCWLSRNEGQYAFFRLINDFWYAAECLAKLGYGDFIPQTIFGRLLAVAMVLLGTIYVSLGFVVLINLLELSPHEKLALSLIETVHAEKKIKNSASKIITYMIRLNHLSINRNHLKNFGQRIKFNYITDKLKVELLNFKRLKR